MATSAPIRIDEDLFASAKAEGALMSRSAAQQVAHWIRIGRELEAGGTVSHEAIRQVLAGHRSYDTLVSEEQAVVRAEWSERLADTVEGLDLRSEFEAAGETYAELDADGQAIVREPPRR
jgi:hypothetical protein